MKQDDFWYWMDILIKEDLIGDTISKGTGMYKKEYIYIKIPENYGYENYCFLLPLSLFHETYFSIARDMKIELIKDPEHREEGVRYKRYHMVGNDLYEQIFDSYEDAILKAEREQAEREAKEREKRERKIIGDIVYGKYMGNNYGDREDTYSDVYFCRDGVYFNITHEKVKNVEVEHHICSNITKHFYRENKEELRKRLSSWLVIADSIEKIDDMERKLQKEGIEATEFGVIKSILEEKSAAILSQLLADLKQK